MSSLDAAIYNEARKAASGRGRDRFWPLCGLDLRQPVSLKPRGEVVSGEVYPPPLTDGVLDLLEEDGERYAQPRQGRTVWAAVISCGRFSPWPGPRAGHRQAGGAPAG